MQKHCGLKLLKTLIGVLMVLVVADLVCLAIMMYNYDVHPGMLVTGFVSAVLTLCDMGAILYVSLIAHKKGEI